MILSRTAAASSSPASARSPPRDHCAHLGPFSLVRFKRPQDLHCGAFRRTWGKYHSAKKELIVGAAAAEANMSLKSDAEPNNNVSMEEEVSPKKTKKKRKESCLAC